jgi:hypothetical protein
MLNTTSASFVTSIRSIYNSSHPLEGIRGCINPNFIKGYLELNENDDKTQVVCYQIFKYHFIGDFDVTPFIIICLCRLCPRSSAKSDWRLHNLQSSYYLGASPNCVIWQANPVYLTILVNAKRLVYKSARRRMFHSVFL